MVCFCIFHYNRKRRRRKKNNFMCWVVAHRRVKMNFVSTSFHCWFYFFSFVSFFILNRMLGEHSKRSIISIKIYCYFFVFSFIHSLALLKFSWFWRVFSPFFTISDIIQLSLKLIMNKRMNTRWKLEYISSFYCGIFGSECICLSSQW